MSSHGECRRRRLSRPRSGSARGGCSGGVIVFFFQAEDGIRDLTVTGVQTCALPISPNPFEGIWSAVARPGLDNKERLTVGEALTAYTKNPAYASFSEQFRGTLTPGKVADIVVLDRDPYEVSIKCLREIRVVRTIIGGKVLS